MMQVKQSVVFQVTDLYTYPGWPGIYGHYLIQIKINDRGILPNSKPRHLCMTSHTSRAIRLQEVIRGLSARFFLPVTVGALLKRDNPA